MPRFQADQLNTVLQSHDSGLYTLKTYSHPSSESVAIYGVFRNGFVDRLGINTNDIYLITQESVLPVGYSRGDFYRDDYDNSDYVVKDIMDMKNGLVKIMMTEL